MKAPGGEKRLSGEERRLFVLLGVPSVGLSLSLAVLSTYLPVLAHRFTSSRAAIGSLVGGEGFVALLVPLWAGGLSDRVDSRFGRRIPFLLGSAPIAALALSLVPFARSLPAMAVAVFFFYLAYFAYLAPYRALYPDLVPKDASGRSQGIQGVLGEVGLGFALVAGGLLLEVWRPLPYLVAAAVLLLGTAALVLGLGKRARHAPRGARVRSPPAEVWALLREHPEIRRFAVANVLLALSLGGLKTFVVLWLTEGLGKTMAFTSAMMGIVAGGAIAGALVAGKLADRHGAARIMRLSLAVFGVGLCLPTFSSSTVVLGSALPIIALCGGASSVLPYAVLMRLMPPRSHGAAAGLFDLSNGLGTLLGPALTGAAIDLLHPLFASTHGLAAMWPVISVSALLSAAVLRAGTRAPARAGGHDRSMEGDARSMEGDARSMEGHDRRMEGHDHRMEGHDGGSKGHDGGSEGHDGGSEGHDGGAGGHAPDLGGHNRGVVAHPPGARRSRRRNGRSRRRNGRSRQRNGRSRRRRRRPSARC